MEFEVSQVILGGQLYEFYSKDDVDRCLYRLKAKLSHKGLSNKELETQNHHLWKQVKHERLERCKARAEACYLLLVRYEQYVQNLSASKETMASWVFHKGYYERWERRWHELADYYRRMVL